MKFFKPDDFREQEWQPITSAQAANIANAKLEREGKVVYGQKNKYDIFEWGQYSDEQFKIEGSGLTDTHRALLINIEELPKKECEHEVKANTVKVDLQTMNVNIQDITCAKCGVKLKATWSVADE